MRRGERVTPQAGRAPARSLAISIETVADLSPPPRPQLAGETLWGLQRNAGNVTLRDTVDIEVTARCGVVLHVFGDQQTN